MSDNEKTRLAEMAAKYKKRWLQMLADNPMPELVKAILAPDAQERFLPFTPRTPRGKHLN